MIVLEAPKISFFRNKTTEATLKTLFNLEMLQIQRWLLHFLIIIHLIRSISPYLLKIKHLNKQNLPTFYLRLAMQKKRSSKILVLSPMPSKEMVYLKIVVLIIWWHLNPQVTWELQLELILLIVSLNTRKGVYFQKILLKQGLMTAL